MNLLYSDILPLGTEDGQQTITERFTAELQKADRLDIAVGYLSGDSLEELDRLTEELHISRVTLIAGMYYSDGIPESIFHATKRINLKWKNEGRGEIRFVRPFKYHGKVYCFYKNGKPFAAMLGSANLGFIKPTASNLRQYELDAVTEDPARVEEIARHIASLTEPRCSANMDEIRDFSLIEETNGALQDVELVHQVPTSDVLFYKDCPPLVSFSLPIKVPAESEKHMDDGKHFTKSNINVCYAAPRSKRKPRDWYETQLTVSVKIYTLPGYPEKNKPFMVVTDDGYRFKAHTTSDHNKQFSAVGDELIMGRWLKGRLAAAGLVSPVNNTQADTERTGMITKEILAEYGRNQLTFKKTAKKFLDDDGTLLDIWLLSFDNDEPSIG